MKLDNFKDEIAIVNSISDEEEEVKALVYMFSIIPKKGQKCYKMDLASGEVSQLDSTDYKEDIIYIGNLKETPKIKTKVIIKENHIYITAINKKNAVKKFKKILQ